MSFCKVLGKEYVPGTTPERFDYIIDGDYVYFYIDSVNNPERWGWRVELATEAEKEVYGPLKDEINGIPIVDISYLFDGCNQMKRAPILPKYLQIMKCAFRNCSNLVTPPIIPDSVKNMDETFCGCERLEYAPDIPKNVIYLRKTFMGCVEICDLPHFDREAAFLKNPSYTSQAFCGCPHITEDARRNPVVDVLCVDKEGCILSVAFVNGYEVGYKITMKRDGCKTNSMAFLLFSELEVESNALLEELKDGYGEIDEFTVSQIVMLNSCSVEALKILTWEAIKRREAAGIWKW